MMDVHQGSIIIMDAADFSKVRVIKGTVSILFWSIPKPTGVGTRKAHDMDFGVRKGILYKLIWPILFLTLAQRI